MRRLKGVFKSGICLGLVLTLMLSGTSCGKKDVEVTDYGSEADNATDIVSDNASDSDSDEAASASESGYENLKSDGRSLTEIFGKDITVNESFSAGGISADYDFSYKVPEVDQINVYEGSFIANDSDIEKQIVSNFFGGTEKELDEIKYVNDSDYIPLLYKYRNILMSQAFDITDSNATTLSEEEYNEYLLPIDSSFDKVYNWVDETSYYIHMYEGEYNGNRYGMIYSYDNAKASRNIFICPISIAEYFPDTNAETMFVVDSKFNSESGNLCNMSETDIKNDAGDIIERLGFNNDDVVFTVNPAMAVPEASLFTVYGNGDAFNGMPKLVFSDADMVNSARKMNQVNPTGMTYSYRILKEQQSAQGVQSDSAEANFTENGYAVYLCSEPFSDKINPERVSSFNRGSIYYTDKGLFSVDISLVTEIDNKVEGVQLLSFDNIKEAFEKTLENDPDISQRDSASLEVFSIAFTYVLIGDDNSPNKATYVPAWYFITKDNKLKAGEESLTYSHVINALDGSDLTDLVR